MAVIPTMATNQTKYLFERRLRPTIKMAYARKFNFAHSFRPIYYFCRAFGLMPFKITYHSNGTIQGFEVGTIDIIWFIMSLTFNLILAFALLKHPQHMQDIRAMSIILVGGDFILQIISMIFDAIIVGMDMCNCSKLARILKKLNIFDEEVSGD